LPTPHEKRDSTNQQHSENQIKHENVVNSKNPLRNSINEYRRNNQILSRLIEEYQEPPHVPIQNSARPQTNNKVTENQNKQSTPTMKANIDQSVASNQQVAKQPTNYQAPSLIKKPQKLLIDQSTLNELAQERHNRLAVPLEPRDKQKVPEPKIYVPIQNSARPKSNEIKAKTHHEQENNTFFDKQVNRKNQNNQPPQAAKTNAK
jgi:hypothetical protein